MRMVKDQDNSKSRLEAPPTQCPRCKTLMKVRKCVPLPGRKFVDVDYRCDECGAEVLRAVPRGR
jgi:DNA-directed RNA polymerase subunit RPC12/RpoP